MPNLFLDTNIVLDLLGRRDPFYEEIAMIATLAEQNELSLFVSSLTLVNSHYILAKYEGPFQAIDKIQRFKPLIKTIDLTDKIIEKSISSHFKDFEDAIQYHSAVESKADYIITRNSKDFKLKDIQLLTAKEFLNTL